MALQTRKPRLQGHPPHVSRFGVMRGKDAPAGHSRMCPACPGSLRGLQPWDHISSRRQSVDSTKRGRWLVYKHAASFCFIGQLWDTPHTGLCSPPRGTETPFLTAPLCSRIPPSWPPVFPESLSTMPHASWDLLQEHNLSLRSVSANIQAVEEVPEVRCGNAYHLFVFLLAGWF